MIEDYFRKLFQALIVSPAVTSFRTAKQRIQEEDGYIRIKCRLARGQRLEFAEYVQLRGRAVAVITYNYHWQDSHGMLLKRGDNVPHHKHLDSFPHHAHTSETEVISAGPATLEDVLKEIEDRLELRLTTDPRRRPRT